MRQGYKASGVYSYVYVQANQHGNIWSNISHHVENINSQFGSVISVSHVFLRERSVFRAFLVEVNHNTKAVLYKIKEVA